MELNRLVPVARQLLKTKDATTHEGWTGAVQAAINGIPVICDSSSLAHTVSEKWQNLETPQLPDRDEWFLKLCHSEWTVEEIGQGTPIIRLQKHIEHFLHTHH